MKHDAIFASLPTELRGRYEESSRGMTPTVLRMRFGLRQLDRDDEDQVEPALATNAMKAWASIHETHWRSMADRTTEKTAAFLRSAKHARLQLQAIDREHEAWLDEVDRESAALARSLDLARRPPTSQGDATIDAEVRQLIRAEPDPNKAMAIARMHPRAVATLPEGIGQALVGVDAYASLSDSYLRSVVPDTVTKADRLRAEVQSVTMATTELHKAAGSLIDLELAKRLEDGANWKAEAA